MDNHGPLPVRLPFGSVSEQSTKTFFFSYMFGHWSLDQLPRLPKESKPKATKQA